MKLSGYNTILPTPVTRYVRSHVSHSACGAVNCNMRHTNVSQGLHDPDSYDRKRHKNDSTNIV
uniref:SFRICE_004367 n=1 Tax=Spodoptera frugiperda TaxID=7108 RepID=A0A2H1WR94_SPOFR